MPKLTFDDVAVMFSKDEWILLDGEQQQLYQDVMLENYWNLLSVGFKIRKPDLICLMEEGTKLWVPDMYDSKATKPEQDPCPPTTGLPPYTCAACLKSFRSRWSLRRHEGVHTGVKPFQCLSCGCCFSQAYRLQRHRALREGLAKPHDCPCCTRRFWCRMGLSQHLRSHAGQQPNACLVCTKLSRPGHANLENEGRTAVGDGFPEGAHDTGGCSRTFCTGQLPVAGKPQGPIMLQPGILSHSCFQCGKSFSSCRLLARHCLSVHTAPAERLHQGLVCGKRFVFSWKLQEHVDTHDHRLKLHPCLECGKRFFGQSKVRRHQMVHTGEKPYPCPCCDRRFCQKSYVAVHVKMAHGAGKVRAPLRSWHSGAGRSRAKASEERNPRLPEAARSQAITAADVKSTFAV
ncbi:zinc finger protein 12-like [Elgaria multicarinata webbii]|uniref:zinc finger protein 12-like n=1 Tax=Elgaria multicarinata webbii TaxID=159646 RepID=UPI002FCD417D